MPIFDSRLLIFCLLLALCMLPASARDLDDTSELFNPLLGIDYSHWLTGAVGQIASEDEIDEYLELIDDIEAEAFIAAFWALRNEGTRPFQKTPEQLHAARAVEADKRFSQGAFPGRLTDRGKILVLFGEPEEITFETPQRIDVPPLETWWYRDAEVLGLHGEKPRQRYQFLRQKDDRVVLYTGQTIRDPRQRLRQRRIRP
ncbi:MAG: GWxTD domain-containing protein [Acidobacteriota bacterium]